MDKQQMIDFIDEMVKVRDNFLEEGKSLQAAIIEDSVFSFHYYYKINDMKKMELIKRGIRTYIQLQSVN